MAKTTKKASPNKKPATRKAKAPREGAEVQAKASEPKAKKAKVAGAAPAKRAPLAPKTYFAPWGKEAPKWRLVDASGLTLGRISSHIATILMGKHLPQYTRHAATGDFVVVVNASKIVLTGRKWSEKLYHWHTGYPGGVKTLTAQEMLDKHPERLIESAVHGMLPKGHVGRLWMKRLRIFAGAEHPHTAQKPEPVKLPNLGVTQNQ